jgi:GNAT superfamily N-acetyltransferase
VAILPEALEAARRDLSLYDGATRIRDAVGDGHGSDAQFIRELRNAVRQNLTRAGDEISVNQQAQWWESPERERRRITIAECWSMMPPSFGNTERQPLRSILGFGMVSKFGSEGWLTGVITEGSRGKGHGRALFAEMLAWCKSVNLQPWLEVFTDNLPARRLYLSLGFVTDNTRLVRQPGVGLRAILVMTTGKLS